MSIPLTAPIHSDRHDALGRRTVHSCRPHSDPIPSFGARGANLSLFAGQTPSGTSHGPEAELRSGQSTRSAGGHRLNEADLAVETQIDGSIDIIRQNPISTWRSVSAQSVKICGPTFEFRFSGPVHNLVLHESNRQDGETNVSGARPSRQRNVRGTLSWIPAGAEHWGWSLPSTIGYTFTDIFLPSQEDVFGESLRLTEIATVPRLYFEDRAILSTVTRLKSLMREATASSRLYAETLGATLTLEVFRGINADNIPARPAKGGLAGWQRRVTCDYIEENITEGVSLRELANLARLSPFHFCRAFKQTMGHPPHQYQTLRRIERAKTLLGDRSLSVSEIAHQTGFAGPARFSSTFRKVTGHSPSEFRRELL